MKNTSQIVSTLLTIAFAGSASASVAGAQGLYGHNYIVGDYSVMDVYIKFNSAVGVGNNGERVINVGGLATTSPSSVSNSLGLAFQHSNTSWMPNTGNNSWDSFVTIGARTQGAGNTGGVTPDPYFTNPNSNVGSIIGGFNSSSIYVGPGWYQASPLDAGFETNASANADKLVMLGRFSLKTSDIIDNGGTATFVMAMNWTGKSTAQTGGTTMYTLASAKLKTDAATSYTTGGKTWNFDTTFDGVSEGQAAWTFAVPTPGAVGLIGVASLLMRRRK